MHPRRSQVRHSRRGTALLAAAVLALTWVAVPVEACLAALAQLPAGLAGEAASACLACADDDIPAAGAGHRQCEAAGCVAEAMPPCPAGLDTVPGGGQPPLAAARVGLRLPVSDPHAAPLPSTPPPDSGPSYLRCCILLI